MSTTTVIFLPTIIMVLSLLLWPVKKVHNSLIQGIIAFSCIGYILGIFLICVSTREEISSPGIFGGLIIALIITAANSYQYILYTRKLNNNRCPHCHNIGLERINKEIDTHTSGSRTIYEVKGGKYGGRTYQTSYTKIIDYITYTNRCKACDAIIVWTEKKENELRGDNRPDELKKY